MCGRVENKIVVIKPIMPNVGIIEKANIIPITELNNPSFRFMSVLPWLFMRFAELK